MILIGSALLARLTSGVDLDEEKSPQRVVNFKRMQRETRRTIAEIGISSKAHEAIRLQLEEHKHQRQERSRDQRRAEGDYKRQVKVEKRKQKHRGR